MDEDQIKKYFEDADAILYGHFILSSGLRSPMYVQCARVLMDAALSEKLCTELIRRMHKKLGTIKIDMVVSPAMGGVVVGYEMGRQLGVPAIFCERVEGEFTFRRGFEVPRGAKVLLVEDVVTTGKSSLETMKCIKEAGGEIVAEVALIDRSNGEHNLPTPLVTLLKLNIPAYRPDQIPPEMELVPAIKPGSRGLK